MIKHTRMIWAILAVMPAMGNASFMDYFSSDKYADSGNMEPTYYVGGSIAASSPEKKAVAGQVFASKVTGTVIAGANANEHIGMEFRYSHHAGALHVQNATKAETNAMSGYSNIAVLMKLRTAFGPFTPYLLGGVGRVSVQDGGKEYGETGIEYGAGVSYQLSRSALLFIDYLRMYHGSGFGGKYSGRDVIASSISLGLAYRF